MKDQSWLQRKCAAAPPTPRAILRQRSKHIALTFGLPVARSATSSAPALAEPSVRPADAQRPNSTAANLPPRPRIAAHDHQSPAGPTVAHAAGYIDTANARPIATTASIDELRARLAKPLPESSTDAERVIDELVRDTEGGISYSSSGRFFGWVIGGTLPAALAADWLTAAWDQNAASNLTAPAEAVVEEVCGDRAKQLLGIPAVGVLRLRDRLPDGAHHGAGGRPARLLLRRPGLER